VNNRLALRSVGLMRLLRCAALALVATAGATLAYAADVVPARAMQYVTLPEPAGTPMAILDTTPGLIRVAVPRATCAAVSDQFNILVVGSQSLKGSEGKELYVFKLGPNGEPTGAPEILNTPKVPEVGDSPNQVLSLKFHPKLPLLYVWQDTDDKKIKRADAVNEKYAHLLIYSVDAAGKLTFVAQGAVGMRFDMNNIWGDMAVGPQLDKLYVPNLRTPAKSNFTAVGYIGLDPKTGLIAMEESEEKDPTTKAPVIVKREKVKLWPLGGYGADSIPTGLGYVVGSEGTFTTNGYTTISSFDPENRQGWHVAYSMPYVSSSPIHISPHPNPKNWRFYAVTLGSAWVYSMPHADGQITGVPQIANVTGLTAYSPCVIMPKRNQLAVGGGSMLCVVGLNPEGMLTKEAFAVKINSLTVRAVAYSDRADKLFVAENPKPEAPAK
jgi:hypothetical protein